jgi:hypothetical protein
MSCGRYRSAIQAVEKMDASLPRDIPHIKSSNIADCLESYLSVRAHVLIRFGQFDDILDLPLPNDKELYCVNTTTLHYAKESVG